MGALHQLRLQTPAQRCTLVLACAPLRPCLALSLLYTGTPVLPTRIDTIETLEDLLSEPTSGLVDATRGSTGALIVLGAGGKMGPTLARMARRAADAAQVTRRVIAVSRFQSAAARQRLEVAGVETVACDLLDEHAVMALPDATDVIYMAGMRPSRGRRTVSSLPRSAAATLRPASSHSRRAMCIRSCPRDTGRANRISQRQWASTP